MVTPAVRREAAAHLGQVHGVSQRRACQAIGVDRSSIRYRSRRPDDGAIRSRLREIAAVRRRFGYRRLHILLRREGILLNHKKLRRLYAEERLQVRRRGGRKRALGTRAPLALPQGVNQRWSLDFLHDQLSDGRRFRILVQPRSAFESIADHWAPVRWDCGLFSRLRAAGSNRAIPCSDCAQQRHKIIRNAVALVGKESVSVVTGGSGPRDRSGEPTHAHLHHRQ
jgi:putative transposase